MPPGSDGSRTRTASLLRASSSIAVRDVPLPTSSSVVHNITMRLDNGAPVLSSAPCPSRQNSGSRIIEVMLSVLLVTVLLQQQQPPPALPPFPQPRGSAPSAPPPSTNTPNTPSRPAPTTTPATTAAPPSTAAK